VSKADLLESGADDAAVRMALGEAQVIAETKQNLSDAGVDPATLEAAAAAGGSNVVGPAGYCPPHHPTHLGLTHSARHVIRRTLAWQTLLSTSSNAF